LGIFGVAFVRALVATPKGLWTIYRGHGQGYGVGCKISDFRFRLS